MTTELLSSIKSILRELHIFGTSRTSIFVDKFYKFSVLLSETNDEVLIDYAKEIQSLLKNSIKNNDILIHILTCIGYLSKNNFKIHRGYEDMINEFPTETLNDFKDYEIIDYDKNTKTLTLKQKDSISYIKGEIKIV